MSSVMRNHYLNAPLLRVRKRNLTSKLDQSNHNHPEEWLQAQVPEASTVHVYGIGSKQEEVNPQTGVDCTIVRCALVG
jgi:hypothetical protein